MIHSTTIRRMKKSHILTLIVQTLRVFLVNYLLVTNNLLWVALRGNRTPRLTLEGSNVTITSLTLQAHGTCATSLIDDY